TIALVGPGKPTFFADPAQSIGSNIIGDRTAVEPELRGPGNVSRGRPGRTTFESFSTADLAGPVGVLARSHILDWLEDDVSVLASASGGDPMTVQVYAASGKGIVTAYRYDFGDGSPMLETGSPAVTHHVASGGRAGPVAVSATDSLRHVLGQVGIAGDVAEATEQVVVGEEGLVQPAERAEGDALLQEGAGDEHLDGGVWPVAVEPDDLRADSDALLVALQVHEGEPLVRQGGGDPPGGLVLRVRGEPHEVGVDLGEG